MRAGGMTICRTAGIPRGHVAVDYVRLADCTRGGDSTTVYTGAVVVDADSRPSGTTLLICSDQRVPSGWFHTTGVDSVTAQCPREPGKKLKGPAVIEIVKGV
jgi:hypothetical protein